MIELHLQFEATSEQDEEILKARDKNINFSSSAKSVGEFRLR